MGSRRAGSRVLETFCSVLSAQVLRAHAAGPLSSSDLAARMGWAAEGSLRAAVGNLSELGALRRAVDGEARTGLTAAGRELLAVADAIAHWLEHSPFAPLDIADTAARGTIRALVSAWGAKIVDPLAVGPRSLAELGEELPDLSYSAAKRRLAKLRAASLTAYGDRRGRSPRHHATQLLRYASGPVGQAARWERDHLSDAPGFETRDVTTLMLLALPLLDFPRTLSGSCTFVAANADRSRPEPGPVVLSFRVEGGEISTLDTEVASAHATLIMGFADIWLEALTAPGSNGLRIQGPDSAFATLVLERLRRLIGTPGRTGNNAG